MILLRQPCLENIGFFGIIQYLTLPHNTTLHHILQYLTIRYLTAYSTVPYLTLHYLTVPNST